MGARIRFYHIPLLLLALVVVVGQNLWEDVRNRWERQKARWQGVRAHA